MIILLRTIRCILRLLGSRGSTPHHPFSPFRTTSPLFFFFFPTTLELAPSLPRARDFECPAALRRTRMADNTGDPEPSDRERLIHEFWAAEKKVGEPIQVEVGRMVFGERQRTRDRKVADAFIDQLPHSARQTYEQGTEEYRLCDMYESLTVQGWDSWGYIFLCRRRVGCRRSRCSFAQQWLHHHHHHHQNRRVRSLSIFASETSRCVVVGQGR